MRITNTAWHNKRIHSNIKEHSKEQLLRQRFQCTAKISVYTCICSARVMDIHVGTGTMKNKQQWSKGLQSPLVGESKYDACKYNTIHDCLLVKI